MNFQTLTYSQYLQDINLAQMQLDNSLQEDISMFGQEETSIFTDYKGHQGQRNRNCTIWLNCI